MNRCIYVCDRLSYGAYATPRDRSLHMEHKKVATFEIESQPPENTVLQTFDNDIERPLKVRLDKWLWAARFYKTRALARSAIEQGKVIYDGEKTIPTKDIALGAQVLINQGSNKKCIEVRKLSTRRRSANEAGELYAETEVRRSVRYLRTNTIYKEDRTHIRK